MLRLLAAGKWSLCMPPLAILVCLESFQLASFPTQVADRLTEHFRPPNHGYIALDDFHHAVTTCFLSVDLGFLAVVTRITP